MVLLFFLKRKKIHTTKILHDEVVIIIVALVVTSRPCRSRDARAMFFLVIFIRLSQLGGTARSTNGLVLRPRRTPSNTIPKNRTTSTFNDATRDLLLLLLLLLRGGHRRE